MKFLDDGVRWWEPWLGLLQFIAIVALGWFIVSVVVGMVR